MIDDSSPDVTNAPTRAVGGFLVRDGMILLGKAELHHFVVERWLGTPTNCSTEHSVIEWHSPTQLAGVPLASERYREILAELG
jgi:hypothetical protein